MSVWLGVDQVAARLHCSPRTVERKIRAGEIRAAKPARHWVVSETDLDTYLHRLATASTRQHQVTAAAKDAEQAEKPTTPTVPAQRRPPGRRRRVA